MATVQRYLNPITLEAKLFAQSLELLAENFNALDVHLIEALENVMMSIEKFIDKNANNEIVDTSKTKLAQCNSLHHIQRSFHCLLCKRDLGKTMTRVALHLAEECVISALNQTERQPMKNPEKQPTKVEVKQKKKEVRVQQKEQRLSAALKINKKTSAFLSLDYTNLNKLLSESVELGEKLKCLPDYNDIEKDIMEIIKPEFPQQSIKVYKFGSRLTGIGTRESDLDIFIDVGDKFRKFEHRPTKESIGPLHKLHNAMKLHQNSWKAMVLVQSARVPILKTIHTKTGIECDINLSNSLGCINTQFLEYLFSLQPISRLMCIYMKKWLARTNQKGDFNTYSMCLMVIFYLQQHLLFPPISKFFENVDVESAVSVGPWLISFVGLPLKNYGLQMAETSNLIGYIKGFFEFYLDLDYESSVICPYAGKLIKKKALNTAMPDRYLSYIVDKKDAELGMKKPIVVQDPIQLNNNVTKNLTEIHFYVFKEFMIRSLDIVHKNNIECPIPKIQA